MARFLACMFVMVELPARHAKCLIRNSSVLENKRGKRSAPTSMPCCNSESKPPFMLLLVIATVTEDEVDPT